MIDKNEREYEEKEIEKECEECRKCKEFGFRQMNDNLYVAVITKKEKEAIEERRWKLENNQ